MSNKILITGGAGFVGTNLIKYLLEETDWEINILDNLSNDTRKNLDYIKDFSEDRVSFLKGDIRKREDVESAMEDCNLVVNLAAQVGVEASQEDPLEDARINIMGLLNLLEESKGKVDKFVQSSSAACLGEQNPPLNEEIVPQPSSPYGASKLAGEGYCPAYSGSFNLDTVILRFSNIYGPYSEHKGSVIHKFIRRALNNEPLTIHGDGTQTRDFIYVKDICKAIYLSLTEESEDNLFHVGTGEETSINEIVEMMERVTEKDIETTKGPFLEGQLERSYFDNAKIKKALSWKPSYSLQEGLKKTVDWFKEN